MVEGGALITSAHPLHDAAMRFAHAIENADRVRGKARVAISGGSAASVVGEARKLIPANVWSRLCLTWADERCVPFASADSNRGTAYKEGWLDANAAVAHELPLFRDDESPESACARVTNNLNTFFDNALDVVLLGLGEDGHIASLFPGHPSLREKAKLVVAISDSPKPPPRRITLTLPLIDSAATKLVYAVGSGKRDAIERSLSRETILPLSHLQHIDIITDLALGDRK